MTSKKGVIIHTGTGVISTGDQTLNRLTVSTFDMSEESMKSYARAVQKLTGLKYSQSLDLLSREIGYKNWSHYREVRPKIHCADDGKEFNQAFDILPLEDRNILLVRALEWITVAISNQEKRIERNYNILEKVTSEFKFGNSLKEIETAERALAEYKKIRDGIEARMRKSCN